MKTRIFKTLLPLFAIMMAMGLSYAVESARVSQIGWFEHPVLGLQSMETDCAPVQQGEQCTTPQGYQLYNIEDLDDALNNELRRIN